MMRLILASVILFGLTSILADHSVFSLNCSIYKSDKDIILSLPFLVFINPVEQQNITYSMVNFYGFVTALHLFGQKFIPLAIFCFTQLKSLSVANSTFNIPTEIGRLASILQVLRISNISPPQKKLPAELFMLHSLHSLHLTDCGIEILSNDIEKLSGLTTLNLTGNKLVGSLPNGIKQLKSLNSLDVSSNPLLTSLEVLNGLTSLKELKASHCGLSRLPIGLPYLSILNLSHNKLTSLIDIKTMLTDYRADFNRTVPLDCFSLYKLSELDVSNNKIFTIPEDLYCLISLRKLHLQNNQFSHQETEWIIGRFRRGSRVNSIVII